MPKMTARPVTRSNPKLKIVNASRAVLKTIVDSLKIRSVIHAKNTKAHTAMNRRMSARPSLVSAAGPHEVGEIDPASVPLDCWALYTMSCPASVTTEAIEMMRK